LKIGKASSVAITRNRLSCSSWRARYTTSGNAYSDPWRGEEVIQVVTQVFEIEHDSIEKYELNNRVIRIFLAHEQPYHAHVKKPEWSNGYADEYAKSGLQPSQMETAITSRSGWLIHSPAATQPLRRSSRGFPASTARAAA
jgi:hypothetical protein